ncbi:MAG TPA: hypothetical protein VLG50_07360, partial [Candidatus Saccharimonadales bacterium]|nr:hypothetical protein [Candidatus Saccharimonadales bacterium]
MNRDMKKQIRRQITMEMRKEEPNMEMIRFLYEQIGVVFDGMRVRVETKRRSTYKPVDITVPQYFDLKKHGFKDNEIAEMY